MFIKIYLWVFSGMLITNPRSDFENSKLRFQYGGPKFGKLSNFHRNLYILYFWIADSEYAVRFSKFKIVDPIWRKEILKKFQFLCELVYGGFRGCWLRFCRQILKIKNDSANIVDHGFEYYFIYMKISCKFVYSGFFLSLISNSLSVFRN